MLAFEIWQLSAEYCDDVYRITRNFPDDERFGLTSQLRRASVSIPSNIAEGSSRTSRKDFARLLSTAMAKLPRW
jgi:four helix bundle protein